MNIPYKYKLRLEETVSSKLKHLKICVCLLASVTFGVICHNAYNIYSDDRIESTQMVFLLLVHIFVIWFSYKFWRIVYLGCKSNYISALRRYKKITNLT